MKTHPILVAAVLAGFLSNAVAEEAAPSHETPAFATGESTAPALAPESAEGAAPAAAATSEAAAEVDAESTPVPAKIDPAAILQGDEDSLPLIPDSIAPASESDASFLSSIPEGDAAKSGPLKKGSAEQLRQAARIRDLKTIVLKEPEIVAQKQKADTALTFEGRRVAMRNFYTLVSERIIKLDPTLKEPVETDLQRKLGRLDQRRIRPTKLVEPIKELTDRRSPEVVAKKE